LSGFFKGFLDLIEKIHFDDNMPSNHNICITNLKSPYLLVRQGDKWISKPKKEVLDNFISKKYIFIDEKCNELEKKNIISKKIVKDFREFQHTYDNTESQINTKKDIIMMLYNNKNKIKIK
jgi:hypothetical protein